MKGNKTDEVIQLIRERVSSQRWAHRWRSEMAGVAVFRGADWGQEEAKVLGRDCHFEREYCCSRDVTLRVPDLLNGYGLGAAGWEFDVRGLLACGWRGCGCGHVTGEITCECRGVW